MGLASLRFVEVFCTVVEAGSFTSAASELGVTPAAVSRSIARAEETLGVALFRRSTRSMRLTEAGQTYYEECRSALGILQSAEQRIAERSAEPRGTVRVSLPTTQSRVLGFVSTFAQRYPKVEVEVEVDNRNVDFVARGFDMAIRAGDLADSSLVARKLGDETLGVFASPGYLARRGRPRSPAELERHDLIGFVRPSTGRTMPWLFLHREGPFEIAPRGGARVSGDYLATLGLARAGAGLAQAFHFLARADVEAGTLVEVMPGFAGRTRAFTLLAPAGRVPSLAARTFADELVAHYATLGAAPDGGGRRRRARARGRAP